MKLDSKDAYRIVPVHPNDYHLLGINWRNHTYIDRTQPFWLRSANKIFNAIADTLAWSLNSQGVRYLLHYLDDFLLLGTPHTHEAQDSLTTALHLLDRLGVPVANHKTEGPTTSLAFLGILRGY